MEQKRHGSQGFHDVADLAFRNHEVKKECNELREEVKKWRTQYMNLKQQLTLDEQKVQSLVELIQAFNEKQFKPDEERDKLKARIAKFEHVKTLDKFKRDIASL